MSHIRPSWLMCDALVDSLLYMTDTPQRAEQIIQNTTITPSALNQHLLILTAWKLIETEQSTEGPTYYHTATGSELSRQLCRNYHQHGHDQLSPTALMILACAGHEPTPYTDIMRRVRSMYPNDAETIRHAPPTTARLHANGLLDRCITDGRRISYQRTREGMNALNQTLRRWELMLRYLPPQAITPDLHVRLHTNVPHTAQLSRPA